MKLSIVHCPPVTMAIIRRPEPKFQLGFSVEDGIVSQLSYFNFINFGIFTSWLITFFTCLLKYTEYTPALVVLFNSISVF